jgi:hypothetical protein
MSISSMRPRWNPAITGSYGKRLWGRADTETDAQPVGPALVLSPTTALPTLANDPASALIATLSFMRTSPDPDSCRASKVIPQIWSVTLSNGSALRITNHATRNGGPF